MHALRRVPTTYPWFFRVSQGKEVRERDSPQCVYLLYGRAIYVYTKRKGGCGGKRVYLQFISARSSSTYTRFFLFLCYPPSPQKNRRGERGLRICEEIPGSDKALPSSPTRKRDVMCDIFGIFLTCQLPSRPVARAAI